MPGCISLDTSRPPTLEKAPRGRAPWLPGVQVCTASWRGLGVSPKTIILTGARVEKSACRFLLDAKVDADERGENE